MIIKEFFAALRNQDVSTVESITTDDFRANFVECLFFGENSKTRFLSWIKENHYEVHELEYDTRFVTFKQNNVLKGARFTIKDNLIYEYSEYLVDDIKRYKAVVSYNGQNYYGYQRQLKHVTIQGTIESALKSALKEDIEIHASGRTDRAVHAIGQVIHFDTNSKIPIDKLLKIINAFLPADIRFLKIEEVSKAFHARYDIVGKEYVYKISTSAYNPIDAGTVWYVEPFDMGLFKSELNKVIGEHDFYAFCKRPTTSNTVRIVNSISVEEFEGAITVSIKGNGFLRHMVRFIIGAAVMIASKKVNYTIDQVFEKNDNQMIKDMAAPGGLYLKEVFYGE